MDSRTAPASWVSNPLSPSDLSRSLWGTSLCLTQGVYTIRFGSYPMLIEALSLLIPSLYESVSLGPNLHPFRNSSNLEVSLIRYSELISSCYVRKAIRVHRCRCLSPLFHIGLVWCSVTGLFIVVVECDFFLPCFLLVNNQPNLSFFHYTRTGRTLFLSGGKNRFSIKNAPVLGMEKWKAGK